VNINLSYSCSNEISKIGKIPLTIKNDNSICINEVADEILNIGITNINTSAISFYDPEIKAYIYCGIMPNLQNILIPIKLLLTSTVNNIEFYELNIL